MNAGIKRRAGGSLISGSTKRASGSAAAWREELADAGEREEAVGEAEATSAGDGRAAVSDDDEQEIMDPGTPLPSSPEPEPVVAPIATPSAFAEPAPSADSESQSPCVVWLELVSGEDGDDERASEPLEVLLREGLTASMLQRLAPCLPPGRGSPITALVPGLACAFAGHGSLHSAAQAEGEAAVAQVEAAAAQAHSAAGLLTAPLRAPGLALTLACARQLDASHELLGPVLLGRRVLQRLSALAPLAGGPAPLKPLSLRTVAAPEGEAAGPLGLRVEAAAVPSDSRPFLLEETEEPPQSEVLEALEVDIDAREAEVQELKMQTFSRERQAAVTAVDARLAKVLAQLQALSVGAKEGSDDPLAAQRLWLTERIRRLVRLIGKLK